MAKSIKIYGLTGVSEPTYGAGGTPTVGANGIRLAEPVFGGIDYGYDGETSNDPATGGPSQLAAKAGKSVAMAPIVELRGRGGAYGASALPPDFDVLAKACGLDRAVDTTVGAEKVTYTPGSVVSAALWNYAIGERWRTKGMIGSFGFEIAGPSVARATFDLQGFFDSKIDDDTTSAPTIVYSGQQPPTVRGATVQIGNFVAGPTADVALRRVTMAANLERSARNDLASPDGLIGFQDGNFNPTLEIEIEAHGLSTSAPFHEATKLDPYELADASTKLAILVRWGAGGNGIDYNRIAFNAAAAQLSSAPSVSGEGQSAIWTMQFRLPPSAPGLKDNFSLVFD